MRVFQHPNMSKFKCPICGTSEDKPVTLIGISGTERPDSKIIQAEQYHVDCLELTSYEMNNTTIIGMEYRRKT